MMADNKTPTFRQWLTDLTYDDNKTVAGYAHQALAAITRNNGLEHDARRVVKISTARGAIFDDDPAMQDLRHRLYGDKP